MLVHNLTDVETPRLKQFGLVDVSFAVGGALVRPGESLEVPDHLVLKGSLQHLIDAGAAFVGSAEDLPAAYTEPKKVAAVPPSEPTPAWLEDVYQPVEAPVEATRTSKKKQR